MPRQAAVPGRILIVDDEERQRSALAAMLPPRDFETEVASDGQEALERLASFSADVIVADLVMPRMDGFELLRYLKDRGDLTPAIALTGFGSMEKALSMTSRRSGTWRSRWNHALSRSSWNVRSNTNEVSKKPTS
jgi:CheY-like chemotaxis protein